MGTFFHQTMTLRRLLATAVAASGLLPWGKASARGADNVWPLWVERSSPGTEPAGRTSTELLGPLIFRDVPTAGAPGTRISGVRPLFLEKAEIAGRYEWHFLYPVVTYRTSPEHSRLSVLNLINRTTLRGVGAEADAGASGLDLWPFYFSRQTTPPDGSYRAVFPLHGTILRRFGQDRITWTLFPLYARAERAGAATVAAPWPFLKVVSGAGHSGFEFWPVYGRRLRAGDYDEQFALWPLIYRQERWTDGRLTTRNVGILPFYARDEAEGYVSETFAWPFFGYVDRTLPYRYRANHYLWPLWVQGRGDDRRINRWAPFYAHSRIKGTEKTWILWPLWRSQGWNDGPLAHRKDQFVYFLYHATHQRSVTRPEAPAAAKVHVWPLASYWDNGAGRRQLQALSPFEVFFPQNENVRLAWSPLFNLYRFDQAAPGDVRHAALWNAITVERQRETGRASFRLGPLFGTDTAPDHGRVTLLAGLLAWERGATGTGWRFAFARFTRPAAAAPTLSP